MYSKMIKRLLKAVLKTLRKYHLLFPMFQLYEADTIIYAIDITDHEILAAYKTHLLHSCWESTPKIYTRRKILVYFWMIPDIPRNSFLEPSVRE